MRKHQAKVSTTVFIIMLMLNTAQLQGIQDPEVPSPNQANSPWLLHDVIPRLAREMSHVDFKEQLRDFVREPLYLRLSATSDLLDLLRSEEACVTSDYVRSPGAHELNMQAGRVATLLENAFGVRIPLITDRSTPMTRIQSFESAKLQIDAFRRGVNEVIAKHRVGMNYIDLSHQYQVSILAGSVEDIEGWLHTDGANAMADMLEAWYPLGKRFEHLEVIVGRKARISSRSSRDESETRVRDGRYTYQFDNGFATVLYNFLVRQGVIIKIARH